MNTTERATRQNEDTRVWANSVKKSLVRLNNRYDMEITYEANSAVSTGSARYRSHAGSPVCPPFLR